MRWVACFLLAVLATAAQARELPLTGQYEVAQHMGGGVFNRGPLVQPAATGGDPTALVLPAANDTYANWVNAGLAKIGGIPNRVTQCGSTVNPIGGGSDDLTNIQAAINACPAGQVVKLGSGTFTITMSEYIALNKGVTLRGTGNCTNGSSPYCSTVINITPGAQPAYSVGGVTCGTSPSSLVGCVQNPGIFVSPAASSFDWGWSACSNGGSLCAKGTPLTADMAQGDTVVHVTSTTGFSVGMWVLIDEATGAQWIADPTATGGNQMWAAPDFLNTTSSPATGRVAWNKRNPTFTGIDDATSTTYPYNNGGGILCSYSFCDRATAELHLVTAVNSGANTITLDDPVTIAFRTGGGTSITGTISSTALTVVSGSVSGIAQLIQGAGIPQGTYIVSGSGSTWTLSNAATVGTAESMTIGDHAAAIYFPTKQLSSTPLPFVQQAGVENLTLVGATAGGINYLFCAYCWAKNVEVYGWFAGGLNANYAARIEWNTNYVHDAYDPENNGQEYPIAISTASTEVLLTNNIITLAGKGMVGRAAGGNVVSYNYQDMTFYDAHGNGDYWQDMGVNGSHFSGAHHWLFEGNRGTNCDNDFTHGAENYHTYFRNWCTGLRTAFTDPSNGLTVDDANNLGYGPTNVHHDVAPLRAAGTMAWTYWMAYVGNVLGTPGVTTAGNGWIYNTTYGNVAPGGMWQNGWINWTQTGYSATDPNLTGGTPFLFRHADWDTVNGSIADYATGTPCGTGVACSHTLPSSFYLSAAPSFFSPSGTCTYPWPWVTPTAGTQLPVPTGAGCSTFSGLPAMARFQAGTPFVQP